MTFTLSVRPKRQATLPELLLRQVGVSVGDKLVAEVENKKIVLKPQKQAALDAFKALQKAFKQSGIPEKDMQDNLKKIRRKIYLKRYGKSFS